MKNAFTFFVLFIFAQTVVAQQSQTISGFFKQNVETQLNLESGFDKNLSPESIEQTIKYLSDKPHHLGSKGSKENAEYILKQFKSWGWDAKIETFYVLFPTPKEPFTRPV